MPELDAKNDALIELPITRACIVKWERGRAKYGKEFQGDPLEELFAELIDGINYADQAELEGYDMDEIRTGLMDFACRVQVFYDTRFLKVASNV